MDSGPRWGLHRHNLRTRKFNTLGRGVDIGRHGLAGIAIDNFDATGR